MKYTKPRKSFKKRFGQANHFIITALVGLDAIERGDIIEVSKELHTSWSPKEPLQSARRARRFILNTTLISAVDAIDVYLTRLWRAPKWISGDDVKAIYSSAGRSVYKKAMGLSGLLQIPDVTRAMVEVIITWRNNVMHELADNTLSQSSSNVLSANHSELESTYCGLDPSHLEQKANSGGDLTFKETTSLIRASHLFVKEIDARVIERLPLEQFVWSFFIDKMNCNSYIKRKYFGMSNDRKMKMIRGILQSDLGIADSSPILASAVTNLVAITSKDCEPSHG